MTITESGELLSTTLAYLQLGDSDKCGGMQAYSFSQSQDLLAITTDTQSVYVFSLSQLHSKYASFQQDIQQKAFDTLKWQQQSEDTQLIENIKGVLVARPISSRQAIGEAICEVQWVLNDTFLSLTTANSKLIVMDPLCNVFSLV